MSDPFLTQDDNFDRRTPPPTSEQAVNESYGACWTCYSPFTEPLHTAYPKDSMIPVYTATYQKLDTDTGTDTRTDLGSIILAEDEIMALYKSRPVDNPICDRQRNFLSGSV
ncbi:hypothetical protein N7488_009558 [Penicillium malachiteum]|nr:hypothetical protein N7488_009558 [Penicillium malachiteum]